MTFKQLDKVVLDRDVPESALRKGDLGTVVHAYEPEHRSTLEWVGGSFDPEDFDPTEVRFEDPAVRRREVFADEG